MTVNTVDEAWDYFIDTELCSEETLQVVTNINGYSMRTMEEILYATTSYRKFSQLDDDEDEDEDDE